MGRKWPLWFPLLSPGHFPDSAVTRTAASIHMLDRGRMSNITAWSITRCRFDSRYLGQLSLGLSCSCSVPQRHCWHDSSALQCRVVTYHRVHYSTILHPAHTVCAFLIYDIFVNCNWVVTRWQQYSTHLHTNNTQDTKQTIHRTTQQFGRVRAVPRLG